MKMAALLGLMDRLYAEEQLERRLLGRLRGLRRLEETVRTARLDVDLSPIEEVKGRLAITLLRVGSGGGRVH